MRFAEGMARLIGDGFRIFVEIGPNPVLQSYLHDALRAAEAQGRVLGTLARRQDGRGPVSGHRRAMPCRGLRHHRGQRFDGPADPRGLPLYPWNRERFWFEHTVEAGDPVNPPFDHPLLGFRQTGPVPFWLNHLDAEMLPWLADHAVEGVPVLPAAAVLEMALAAARRAARMPPPSKSPISRCGGRCRSITGGRARCAASIGEDGDWELTSRPRLSDDPLTVHAVARLATAGDFVPPPLFGPAEPGQRRNRRSRAVSPRARLGLDYGRRFRTVRRIECWGRTRRRRISTPRSSTSRSRRYLFIPPCSMARCRRCWR